MIQEIQHVIERAKLIKDFVDLPRGSAVHHRIDEIVELLQGLQRREEADHDALNDLWACAESGYSLDDLKAKIKMYLDASPQRVIDDRLVSIPSTPHHSRLHPIDSASAITS